MGIPHRPCIAVLLLGCGLIAAPASSVTASTSTGLTALTDSDMSMIRETGCTFSFQTDNRTLVMAIGHDLMLGVGGRAYICNVGDASVIAFWEGRDGTVCADRRLALRKTGRKTTNEASDSASWPAILTINQGRFRQSVRGIADTAC